MICNNYKQFLVGSLLLCMADTALAHTGILSLPIAPKNGQGAYLTALTVGHGCAASENSPQKPVEAVSAVFPVSPSSIATQINPDNSTSPITDLSSMIEGAVGGGLPNLSLSLIQDAAVWAKNRELNGADGAVHGFEWTEGKMKPKLNAYPPFRMNIPKILPTSCVTKLRIRAAVANYCSKQGSDNANGRADIWLGRLTPLFNDADIQSIGYYPQLVVERGDTPALPNSCGAGFEVAVEPSDEDVDNFLPIKGYWPAQQASGKR